MAENLSDRLSRQGELQIIRSLFNKDVSSMEVHEYDSYIEYYHWELRLLRFGLEPQWILPTLPIRTHGDLRKLTMWLSDNRNLDMNTLRNRMKQELDLPDASLRASGECIELALRIWLTINVRNDGPGNVTIRTPSIQWPETGTSLSNFVASIFPKPRPLGSTNIRFGPQFTVAYMSQACGIKVEWTNCLADHLRVDPLSKNVQIYHLKRCLSDRRLCAGSVDPSTGSLLPAELLQETIWTLNLLFPANDERTVAYLRKCQPPKRFHYDSCEDNRRPLELDTYSYWKQRLEALLEIYNQGPTTFKQSILQQKPHERINLLIAVISGFILALIFGIISSITAIITTRATLQALEVARETYLLQEKLPICPCS